MSGGVIFSKISDEIDDEDEYDIIPSKKDKKLTKNTHELLPDINSSDDEDDDEDQKSENQSISQKDNILQSKHISKNTSPESHETLDLSENGENTMIDMVTINKKTQSNEIAGNEHQTNENEEIENQKNYTNVSYLNYMLNIWMVNIYHANHWKCFILTLLAWIFIFLCIIDSYIILIIWCAIYILYLMECYFCETWKEFYKKSSLSSSAYNTFRFLDALKDTPPVLYWNITCYHYVTHFKVVQNVGQRKRMKSNAENDGNINDNVLQIILWIEGNEDNIKGIQQLFDMGFVIKFFRNEMNAAQYILNADVNEFVHAIIVPIGYDIKRCKKSMNDYWINDGNAVEQNIPYFVFNGGINMLINDFIAKHIIQQQRSRVVTHTASKLYNYNQWNDISNDYPEWKYDITQLSLDKQYCFMSEDSRMDYQQQKKEFQMENKLDDYQSLTEELNIRGYEKSFVLRKENDSIPWWMNAWGFWVASVLQMSLYPRIRLSTMTGSAKWTIVKQIGI